jgi:uncharacterized paraquat-inducible protein A
MIFALYIAGAVILIISIIAGFSSGSMMGFLVAIAGGVSSALIFFALAKILDNQESILFRLYQREGEGKYRVLEKTACPKCSYEYDSERNSCPHCGHRE